MGKRWLSAGGGKGNFPILVCVPKPAGVQFRVTASPSRQQAWLPREKAGSLDRLPPAWHVPELREPSCGAPGAQLSLAQNVQTGCSKGAVAGLTFAILSSTGILGFQPQPSKHTRGSHRLLYLPYNHCFPPPSYLCNSWGETLNSSTALRADLHKDQVISTDVTLGTL